MRHFVFVRHVLHGGMHGWHLFVDFCRYVPEAILQAVHMLPFLHAMQLVSILLQLSQTFLVPTAG